MISLPVWATPQVMIASLLYGGFASWLALQLMPSRTPMSRRVRPYTRSTMIRLGKTPSLMEDRADVLVSASTLAQLFAPITKVVLRLIKSGSDDDTLRRRLVQARMYPTLTPDAALTEFRGRQVAVAVGGLIAGMLLGYLFTATDPNAGVVLMLGTIVSMMSVWVLVSRVEGQIKARRARMRIELFTINQMLAMDMRIGTGVVQALQRIERRSSGEVVAEIKELLSNNRAGMDLSAALLNARDMTPEPHLARLLETMDRVNRRGADANPTELLLALAEDIRSERRDDLQSAAAAARFKQLIPMLLFLAPTMVGLMAAPIPGLIFNL